MLKNLIYMENNFWLNKQFKQTVETKDANITNKEQMINMKLEIMLKEDDIIKSESERILWYLKNYDRYEKLGYSEYLNLPVNINPRNYTIQDIENAVLENYFKNKNDYESYAKELGDTWDKMSKDMIPVMQDLYGFTPSQDFTVAPTVYGTGGGALEKDGVIFFKIPKNRELERNTEERIAHEVLSHAATARLREGTEIDESISTSHQWYKERLMDLLGRTLLVRSGVLKREEVKMDEDVENQVADIVDPIYYLNSNNQDENSLRYNGRVQDLFNAVVEKIKLNNIQESQKIES